MPIFKVLLFIFIIAITFMIMKKYRMNIKQRLIVLVGLYVVFSRHLSSEDVVWQMIPLYMAIVLVTFLLILDYVWFFEKRQKLRLTLIIVLITCIVVSGLATYVFPIEDMPTPTGEDYIGTTSYTLEDDTRQENYGDATGDREIKVQLWYPAASIDGYDQVPWLQDGVAVAKGLSKDMGFPSFMLNHTAKIKSHSYLDAPLKESTTPYPVVVISHGWRGFRNLHTDLAEELASHGYIVASIDHTYGSVATVIDDEVLTVDYEALPERETTDNFLAYANELVYTYAEDISLTIDYLETLNNTQTTSQFYQALDLTKIGLLGHSTGGGADVALALEDDRIQALFGLDAWVESIDESLLSEGLDIPSTFIRSGAWEESYNNPMLYQFIDASSDATLYQIDGTTHYDFTMIYMYSPLTKAIGFTGEVEGRYVYQILSEMMLDFFDQEFMNSNDTIDPNTWEEVRRITIE